VAATQWMVTVADQQALVTVELIETGYLVAAEQQNYRVDNDWSLGGPLFKAIVRSEEGKSKANRKPVCVQVETTANGYRLFYRGVEINTQVRTLLATKLNAHMLYKEPADIG